VFVDGVWLEDSAVAELALILHRANRHALSNHLGLAVDHVWHTLELSEPERLELLPFLDGNDRYAALREALVERALRDATQPLATSD
jgi:hypothetical protein